MTEPRPRTILVVDDSAIIRRLQQAQLEPLKHRVLAAGGGEEALRIAKAEPPDLVVLDVVMPGMDGFKVCTELKADPATKDVPVVVVSALGRDAKDRSFASGADDFMRKPPNTLLLRTRVKAHLRIREAGLTPDSPGPETGPVLVVSGSESLRAVFREHVDPLPLKLHEVDGAAQALAWIEAGNAPHAVVLDMELKEGSALSLAKRLRELPALAATSLLLLYKPEDLTVLEEEQPPVDDYLEKPLSLKDSRHRAALQLRLAQANRQLA